MVIRFALTLVVGAALGALSSLSNQWSSPLTFLLNAGWAWAAVAVLAGWIVRSMRWASLAGVLALLATVFVYYGMDSVLRGEPFATYWYEISNYWLLGSLVAGVLLGVVGALARRPGVLGYLAAFVVPVGATIEMILLPRWPLPPIEPDLQTARVIVWVGAVAWAIVLFVRSRTRSRDEL